MDEKLYTNAVDIQTKQIDELTEIVTLFEKMKTDNLGTMIQFFYIVALADFTITVRFIYFYYFHSLLLIKCTYEV